MPRLRGVRSGTFSAPPAGIDPALLRRLEFDVYLMRPRIWRVGQAPAGPDGGSWDGSALTRSRNGESLLFDTRIEGRRVRILSIPVRSDGQIVGVAQFAESLEDADIASERLGVVLLVMLPLALLVTSAAGVWLTRRALRPVAKITSAASHIEATNLSGRLEEHGDDEFGQLARVINSVLVRLEGSFSNLERAYTSQQRLIADVSHELKTPLTAIKARLGVARCREQTAERYKEHLAAIERSANTMTSIVEDLLLLARADEGSLNLAGRVLPVESLADEAVALVADALGVNIVEEIQEGILLRGDERAISRVIVNLLDNAARHTPPSGLIKLSASLDSNKVRIQVADTGVGIPPEDLPHVFDRFYRVAASRDRRYGGTGLGLAIVQSIVTAHAGSVSITSRLGMGTTVTVELPAA